MAKRKVKALGAWLSVDPEETVIINYDEKLEIVRNTLSNWKYHRLALIGKIAVLKSLVVSQLVYVLSPLFFKHESYQRSKQTLFFLYIESKRGGIKRNTIINDYPDGGFRIIVIDSFSKSLKAIWIKKYLEEEN